MIFYETKVHIYARLVFNGELPPGKTIQEKEYKNTPEHIYETVGESNKITNVYMSSSDNQYMGKVHSGPVRNIGGFQPSKGISCFDFYTAGGSKEHDLILIYDINLDKRFSQHKSGDVEDLVDISPHRDDLDCQPVDYASFSIRSYKF